MIAAGNKPGIEWPSVKAFCVLTVSFMLLFVRPITAQNSSNSAPSATSSRIQNVAPEEMWKRVEKCVFPERPWAMNGGVPDPSKHPVTGAVEIGIIIAPSGDVASYRVLAGPSLLAVSAVDAIRQWKFRPKTAEENPAGSRVRAIASFVPDGTTSIELSHALLPDDFGDPGTTRSTAQTVPRPASSPDCDTLPKLIYRVDPRLAGVQGKVTIDAVIAPDGTLQDIKAVAGPSSLTGAAVEALRQWLYTPYMHNGKPTATKTQLSLTFALSQK